MNTSETASETSTKPVLCESCRYAYAMPGGMVIIGNKVYDQMYCAEKRIGITNSTITECDKYFGMEIA
jgi:hypothetical protein